MLPTAFVPFEARRVRVAFHEGKTWLSLIDLGFALQYRADNWRHLLYRATPPIPWLILPLRSHMGHLSRTLCLPAAELPRVLRMLPSRSVELTRRIGLMLETLPAAAERATCELRGAPQPPPPCPGAPVGAAAGDLDAMADAIGRGVARKVKALVSETLEKITQAARAA